MPRALEQLPYIVKRANLTWLPICRSSRLKIVRITERSRQIQIWPPDQIDSGVATEHTLRRIIEVGALATFWPELRLISAAKPYFLKVFWQIYRAIAPRAIRISSLSNSGQKKSYRTSPQFNLEPCVQATGACTNSDKRVLFCRKKARITSDWKSSRLQPNTP